MIVSKGIMNERKFLNIKLFSLPVLNISQCFIYSQLRYDNKLLCSLECSQLIVNIRLKTNK